MGVYFAYDGTINGDWVSHYAIRLALHRPEGAITLVHVDDGSVPAEQIEERLHLFADRCELVSVPLEVVRHPPQRGVLEDLQALVPPGPDTFLVCGTRAREGKRGYLTGTISERLLQSGRYHTLAFRVVNPGLLGHPQSLLIPLGDPATALEERLPFLRPLVPDLREIHLLNVREVSRMGYRNLAHSRAQNLLRRGWGELLGVEARMRDALDLSQVKLHSRAVISDDVPKEIVIAANHHKADLVLLGASRRNLTTRFFYGNPIEQVLRSVGCDVAIARGPG